MTLSIPQLNQQELQKHSIYSSLLDDSEFDPKQLTGAELESYHNFKGDLRKQQYCLGRQAAKNALKDINSEYENFTILSHTSGNPLWPNNICGSISHCKAYQAGTKVINNDAVALVARTEAMRSLGVDIECRHRVFSPNIKKLIATSNELDWLNSQPALATLLLLSAKETLYKLIFPLYGQYFGFQQAELVFEPEQAHFTARLLFDLPKELELPDVYQIKAFCVKDLILTAAWLGVGASSQLYSSQRPLMN